MFFKENILSYIIIVLASLFIYFVNKFLKDNSILLNYSGDTHQKFVTKNKIPLSGGIFIFLYSFVLFYNQINLIFFLLLIFLLGFFSDLKIFNSPKIRLLLQVAILFFFVYFSGLTLENTKIIIIDKFINFETYNYIFVLFCILILINGTNFIDGLNTNVLGYYIIISFFMFQTNQNFFIDLDINWYLWIFFLFIIYLFNLFNRLFIGDSGAYIIGLVYGYLLIKFFNYSENLSSLYIILLVWYPCFELLFSIIRKFKFNKSPILADTKHFHQLLYLIFKKNFKLSSLQSNILGASFINLYNFIIVLVASFYPNDSQFQMMIIIFNIIVYICFYLNFFKKIYLKTGN